MREQYVTPVGFAKEPVEERRRWIGRILLFVLVAFILWIAVTKVINPPRDENPTVPTHRTEIPASD